MQTKRSRGRARPLGLPAIASGHTSTDCAVPDFLQSLGSIRDNLILKAPFGVLFCVKFEKKPARFAIDIFCNKFYNLISKSFVSIGGRTEGK
jgi:hypothetical protein